MCVFISFFYCAEHLIPDLGEDDPPDKTPVCYFCRKELAPSDADVIPPPNSLLAEARRAFALAYCTLGDVCKGLPQLVPPRSAVGSLDDCNNALMVKTLSTLCPEGANMLAVTCEVGLGGLKNKDHVCTTDKKCVSIL